jgi:Holliday junction resolvasome RuvABC endonuclease subunit
VNHDPHSPALIPGKILGIDLGIQKAGWAYLDTGSVVKRPVILEAGTIREPKGMTDFSPGARAAGVWREITKVIDRLDPDAIAVEDFTLRGYKANQIPVFRLAGTIDTLRGHPQHPATFYSQEEWQRMIIGRARQDKNEVWGVIRLSILGCEHLTNDHEVDAAAVAAAHIFVCQAKARDMRRARPSLAAAAVGVRK